MQGKVECVIWKEAGSWLQTYGEEGEMRLIYLGRIGSESLEAFCRSKGLVFVKGEKRAKHSTSRSDSLHTQRV